MPHYKDGSEVTVGDFVVGKGYNVKDSEGNLRTIAGTVLFVNPGTAACNIQVGIWRVFDQAQSGPVDASPGTKVLPGGKLAMLQTEYGQTDHFEKVG